MGPVRELPLTRGHVALVDDEDFDRFVGDLVHAFDKVAVPKDLQQQLLALFGPMRKQIVGQ